MRSDASAADITPRVIDAPAYPWGIGNPTSNAHSGEGTHMQGGREPGPDHPIMLEPSDDRVIVRVGDTILAESMNALILREANYKPVLYIPREEVGMDLLEPTATSTHCPYKGEASYFGVRDGARDVAWSYEDPFDRMAVIHGHLAFYPDRVDAIETTPKA